MTKGRVERASQFVAKKQGYQRGETKMLSFVRNWNVDAAGLDETVGVLALAKIIRAEFEAKNVAVPEWLDTQLRALNRAVEALTRDAKELRLKEILAQEAQLMTSAEKREKLAKEKEALLNEGVGK